MIYIEPEYIRNPLILRKTPKEKELLKVLKKEWKNTQIKQKSLTFSEQKAQEI